MCLLVAVVLRCARWLSWAYVGPREPMLAFMSLRWSTLAYVGARWLSWAYVGPREPTLGFVGSTLGFVGSALAYVGCRGPWAYIGLHWPSLVHAGCRMPTLVHVSEGGVWWWLSWVWVGLDWLWVDVARNASGTSLQLCCN